MKDGRQAYLVAAHGGFEQLISLLRLLDDPKSDIYLHMDRRAKAFRPEEFAACIRRGTITFVPRRHCAWGSPAFIDVMLSLLQTAAKTPHQYYHLLSGADLPLQTQADIRAYLNARDGTEFMRFDAPAVDPAMLHYRLGLFHPLCRLGLRGGAGRFLERVNEKLQTVCRVNRLKDCPLPFQKGSLWFSVTHAFARFALENAPRYRQYFRFSVNGDELFFHSLMAASPYYAACAPDGGPDGPDPSLRYIDWARGNGSSPLTFAEADLPLLLARPELFARKFDARSSPVLFKTLAARARPKEESV